MQKKAFAKHSISIHYANALNKLGKKGTLSNELKGFYRTSANIVMNP